MAEISSEYVAVQDTGLGRPICWSAVFSGTFVALATELLFATFGLFIGFTISGGGGISPWSQAWCFVTAFVALFLGAWVAARSAENTCASGRMHGIVTWGLTTMWTLAFTIWMFRSALNAAVTAVRPAVATATAAVANSPAAAGMTAGEASTLFLVLFGGIVAGLVASWAGGVLGDRRHRPPEAWRLRRFGHNAPSTTPAAS